MDLAYQQPELLARLAAPPIWDTTGLPFVVSINDLSDTDINDFEILDPLPQAVPEPSTWSLLVGGAMGLVGLRQRRN